MQGNFSYHNPTKLYFGDESLSYLKDELKNFGPVARQLGITNGQGEINAEANTSLSRFNFFISYC